MSETIRQRKYHREFHIKMENYMFVYQMITMKLKMLV